MSNVLGNLFGEIANAIREKTGGTGTMKPAEFPAEIASIVTGGGGGNAGEWVMATGDFTATSGVETITHGLGVVPDIAFVSMSLTGEVTGITSQVLMCSIGFNSRFRDITSLVGGKSASFGIVFALRVETSLPGVTSGLISGTFIDMPDSDSFSPIHSANANTIAFGEGAVFPLHNAKYSWGVMAMK